jgi:hypothetical protein
MFRRVLPLFLVFLLVSGITDDLFASFTPDPDDDVLAAANNTYLSARAAHEQLGERGRPSPPPGGRPAPAPRLSPAPRTDRPAGLAPPPLTGTGLLYALMSLQR